MHGSLDLAIFQLPTWVSNRLLNQDVKMPFKQTTLLLAEDIRLVYFLVFHVSPPTHRGKNVSFISNSRFSVEP